MATFVCCCIAYEYDKRSFLSKSGGTRQFKRGQHHAVFGWDSIIAMYQREVG